MNRWYFKCEKCAAQVSILSREGVNSGRCLRCRKSAAQEEAERIQRTATAWATWENRRARK